MLPLSAFATTAEHAISITNKPGSSFELTHDDTYEVYDLWNEIESEATEDPFTFNQSFSVNIADAIDVYNSIQTNENQGQKANASRTSEGLNGKKLLTKKTGRGVITELKFRSHLMKKDNKNNLLINHCYS